MEHQGQLFIISGPSGSGKTTLRQAILKQVSDLIYSVSYTTRPPRKSEQECVDYCFISKDDFLKGIDSKKWAEWAEVHGNYYGTSAEFIQQHRNEGHDILLDIDTQGAAQIRKLFPDCITLFIMPPSGDTLKSRLTSRGTEDNDAIERRLKDAENEIAQKDTYHHIIINDRLDDAVKEVVSIITACQKR